MKLRMSTVRTRLRLPHPTRSGRNSTIGMSRRTGIPLVQGKRRGELRATLAFDVAAVAGHGHVQTDLAEPVSGAARVLHHLVLVARHTAPQREHPEPELGPRVHRGAKV